MKPFTYKLSAHKKAIFKTWKKNEPFIIKHNGLIEDKESPGERIYKIELEFSNFCEAILGVPVSVPLEKDLKTSFIYKTENSQDASLNLGFLIDFHPGFPGYDSKEIVSLCKKWKRVSFDNVYGECLSRGAIIVSGMHYSDAKPENFTARLNQAALFVKGTQGSKITIYIKEIEISGMAPSQREIKKLATKRWKPAKDKLDPKLKIWQKELKTAFKKLEGEKLFSKEAKAAKKEAMKEALEIQKDISTLSKRSWAKIPEEEKIISKLKKLNSINLKAIDKYIEKNKNVFIPYATNPTSDEKILPDDACINGKCGNIISINASPGEFAPASFVIHALKKIKETRLLATDLKCKKNKKTISSSNIDIRVVKCWYQAGTAWKTTEQERNKKILVPELLLKDDSLVKRDDKNKENYLRLTFPEGEKYEWISNPDEKPDGKSSVKTLKNQDFPVKDSSVLLPFDIQAGKNQQIWVTIKAPENTAAGIYKGKIKLLQGTKTIGHFDIKANIWPFKLPARPYYTSSVYYRGKLSNKYPQGTISSEFKSKEQLKAELKNMLDHGVSNPLCYQPFNNKKLLNEYLQIRKESGIDSPDLYYCYGINIECGASPESMKQLKARVQKVMDFLKKHGISEVYFYGRDEAKGKRLMTQRKSWDVIHKAGGKVIVTGIPKENFERMGDIQDLLICYGPPSKAEAEKWHSQNHKIWCYSNPQGGVENPGVYRRNYGIRLWQNNYDGASTFAYHFSYGNIWNDFDGHYRDENLTYPTIDGVIDTIAWEGYREAVDDARYLTALEDEIKKARKKREKIKAVEKAEKYVENLKRDDFYKINLNEMRAKAAKHIINLKKP